jgi:hypothetical protein
VEIRRTGRQPRSTVAAETQRTIRHTHRAATVETDGPIRHAHDLVADETQRTIGHAHGATSIETDRAIRHAHDLVAGETQRTIGHAHGATSIETDRAIRHAHDLVADETQRTIGHAHGATFIETYWAIEPTHCLVAGATQRPVRQTYCLVLVETCSDKQAYRAATEETAQMIVHVVLFRLKPNLTDDERDALAAALTRATREIPSIRRARVGSRVTMGRPYEQLMTTDYSFAALLEFDNREGLKAYLDHGAHEQLAQRFYASVEQALTYDFEMWESGEGIERMRGGA